MDVRSLMMMCWCDYPIQRICQERVVDVWSLMKTSWCDYTIQRFCQRGWRIYDLFWIQDIKVAYILTSTNSTWVGTDDDDDDDGDDDDDCKCGAASGLDGNSVVKFGIVNDIALLTLPYNSPLAWEHDKIWKCTVKPLGFEVELLMLYYCFPYNTHRIHVWYMC